MRKAEFDKYFAEYEKVVRSHNDLSGIPDQEVRSKIIDNLVYLAGYCNDHVSKCVEELAGKALDAVHMEQRNRF